MYVCIYIYIYISMYVYVYIYISMYVYIYVYIYGTVPTGKHGLQSGGSTGALSFASHLASTRWTQAAVVWSVMGVVVLLLGIIGLIYQPRHLVI